MKKQLHNSAIHHSLAQKNTTHISHTTSQNTSQLSSYDIKRKPPWLKISINTNKNFSFIKSLVKGNRLHTVCEEARCPNIHECWSQHKTATFMILGDTCTRRCRFCSIKTGLPKGLDIKEPIRIAQSVKDLNLSHVVITMVNRDELPDGGAWMVAQTVYSIKKETPQCTIELLTSDFMGKYKSIETVLKSQPDIMSHNIETVKRLTPYVRSRSTYLRSLEVLQMAHEIAPHIPVKSSMMLGLGETYNEVTESLDDMHFYGVSIVNLGQYLQPTKHHLPVKKYLTPQEFENFKMYAMRSGFIHCESAPLVRSSYNAKKSYEEMRKKIHPLYKNDSNT